MPVTSSTMVLRANLCLNRSRGISSSLLYPKNKLNNMFLLWALRILTLTPPSILLNVTEYRQINWRDMFSLICPSLFHCCWNGSRDITYVGRESRTLLVSVCHLRIHISFSSLKDFFHFLKYLPSFCYFIAYTEAFSIWCVCLGGGGDPNLKPVLTGQWT